MKIIQVKESETDVYFLFNPRTGCRCVLGHLIKEISPENSLAEVFMSLDVEFFIQLKALAKVPDNYVPFKDSFRNPIRRIDPIAEVYIPNDRNKFEEAFDRLNILFANPIGLHFEFLPGV